MSILRTFCQDTQPQAGLRDAALATAREQADFILFLHTNEFSEIERWAHSIDPLKTTHDERRHRLCNFLENRLGEEAVVPDVDILRATQQPGIEVRLLQDSDNYVQRRLVKTGPYNEHSPEHAVAANANHIAQAQPLTVETLVPLIDHIVTADGWVLRRHPELKNGWSVRQGNGPWLTRVPVPEGGGYRLTTTGPLALIETLDEAVSAQQNIVAAQRYAAIRGAAQPAGLDALNAVPSDPGAPVNEAAAYIASLQGEQQPPPAQVEDGFLQPPPFQPARPIDPSAALNAMRSLDGPTAADPRPVGNWHEALRATGEVGQ